ncbi:DNA-binding transcriptional regulator, AcrR family [Butyrivibrio proteoclasticus]|uniref:DNA-binding transcriptional regulator, AcrR family n=1 Tax=Butyrivibrio proteoclasticus TaxID=43305 RepID=A0A1I5X094_9FIRM|nr:TetR/AcrR family transcriptional regulator [Butyrivibrio proteoclasticus]SFQ25413.1 DNA-binding transcriptional regulator, AcrR family [Butyrivibrio proteoclasticus]
MTASGETKILHTKERIRNSLIQMLGNITIEKITIKELCMTAGINRTTFYKYYGSQYDVLNEIASIYISKTTALLMENLAEDRKIADDLVNALQFIKDNANFFILFLGKDNLNPISDISSLLPDFNKFVLASMRNSSITEYEKKYLSSFVLHGSVKMISDWISDGCSLSCQKMCSLILNTSGRVIGI